MTDTEAVCVPDEDRMYDPRPFERAKDMHGVPRIRGMFGWSCWNCGKEVMVLGRPYQILACTNGGAQHLMSCTGVRYLPPPFVIGPPQQRLLFCPECGENHVDTGEWATRPHRTHLCAWCGNEWQPADHHTVGVNT